MIQIDKLRNEQVKGLALLKFLFEYDVEVGAIVEEQQFEKNMVAKPIVWEFSLIE